MKLTATVGTYDEFNRYVETEVEFEDVKEYKIQDNFFIVIKNNGEHHATNRGNLTKFTLVN